MEETDPNLYGWKGFRISDDRGEHWNYFKEGENEYRGKFHALRWQLYIKQKYYLVKRVFLVVVPYTKGVEMIFTCVKDDVVGKNYCQNAIVLHGFDFKLF